MGKLLAAAEAATPAENSMIETMKYILCGINCPNDMKGNLSNSHEAKLTVFRTFQGSYVATVCC